MGRKPKTEPEQPSFTADGSAFVETEAALPARAPRGSRLAIRFDPEGRLDFSSVDDAKLDKLVDAIAQDDRLLNQIVARSPALTAQLGLSGPGVVKPAHVKRILKIAISLEKLVVPPIVAKQISARLKRPFHFDPDIVNEAFAVADADLERAAEPGADAANEHLPASIKEYIVKVGPLGEFVSILADIAKMQIQLAVLKQAARDAHRSEQPVNGEARPIATVPIEVGSA